MRGAMHYLTLADRKTIAGKIGDSQTETYGTFMYIVIRIVTIVYVK